jgi:hypothetical protein
MLFNEEIENR